MDAVERAMLAAWWSVREEAGRDAVLARRVLRRSRQKFVRQALRSRCLVLRAADRRLERFAEVVWKGEVEVGGRSYRRVAFALDRAGARGLCAPVWIPWPGVGVGDAAGMLGVTEHTVRRWVRCGLLDAAGSGCCGPSPRRRVWTVRPLAPGGVVTADPRTVSCEDLSVCVGEGYRQTLGWVNRGHFHNTRMYFWECPLCGGLARKLFWPVPTMTLGRFYAGEPHVGHAMPEGFACLRCAGLWYDFRDQYVNPRTGKGYDAWDRYVQRVSGGVLRGCDVDREAVLAAAGEAEGGSAAGGGEVVELGPLGGGRGV